MITPIGRSTIHARQRTEIAAAPEFFAPDGSLSPKSIKEAPAACEMVFHYIRAEISLVQVLLEDDLTPSLHGGR
jgi:hypothetical protein